MQQKKLAWVRKKYKYGYLVYHRYIGDKTIVKEYENELKSLESCILRQTILIKRNADIKEFSELEKTEKYNTIVDSEEYNIMKEMI